MFTVQFRAIDPAPKMKLYPDPVAVFTSTDPAESAALIASPASKAVPSMVESSRLTIPSEPMNTYLDPVSFQSDSIDAESTEKPSPDPSTDSSG